MNILAIDTSTKILALAVIKNGTVGAIHNYARQMRHSKNIVRCLERVLKDAKTSMMHIDQIACGVGPGSYTGLRIGHSFIKGLALYRNIPVIPFSSLELIAYNIKEAHRKIAVLQNARRGKFYCALFKKTKNGLKRSCKDSILSLDEVKEVLCGEDEIAVTGDALERFSDDIGPCLKNKGFCYSSRYWYARAENMTALLLTSAKSRTISSTKLVPNYLRITEAEEKFGRVM